MNISCNSRETSPHLTNYMNKFKSSVRQKLDKINKNYKYQVLLNKKLMEKVL